MSWKDESEPNIKFCLGRKLNWFKSSSQYRTLDTIDGEPMEFEWHIFPGFTTLQLCNKVHEFMSQMSDPSEFKGRIILMSMLMTSYGDLKTLNENAMLTPTLFPNLQKDSHQDDGHFSDLDQKSSGILHILTDHKENGTESLN